MQMKSDIMKRQLIDKALEYLVDSLNKHFKNLYGKSKDFLLIIYDFDSQNIDDIVSNNEIINEAIEKYKNDEMKKWYKE